MQLQSELEIALYSLPDCSGEACAEYSYAEDHALFGLVV